MKPVDLTLGILAGGQATRLGGVDKAWLVRDGVAQVERIVRRFRDRVASVVVSANRGLQRYADAGLHVVVDGHAGIGPIAGLQALSKACKTAWLLTLPVDIVDANDCLIDSLAAAGANGASVEDDEGHQPLVALWPTQRLHDAAEAAISRGDLAVHALQAGLGMSVVALAGVRLGNLNTPVDLEAAGVRVR